MSARSVRLHRVLRTKPEKVYRAFLEPDAMSKWIAPYGFTCKVHQMDARVGGTFRMSFNNFSTGNGHAFGGEYLELVPNELIRYTDKFDDPSLPGVLEVTVTLKSVLCGTEVNKHGCLVARQGRTLIELAVDLPIELTNTPSAAQCLGFVELLCSVAPHRQQADIG